jgi:hypothetical protein
MHIDTHGSWINRSCSGGDGGGGNGCGGEVAQPLRWLEGRETMK